MDANLPKPQSKRFRDSAEKFKIHKESGPVVTEKPKVKAFVDPFTRKCMVLVDILLGLRHGS